MVHLLVSVLFEWISLACLTRDRLRRHGQERLPRLDLGVDQGHVLMLSQLEHLRRGRRDICLSHTRQEIEIPDGEPGQQDDDEDPGPCRKLYSGLFPRTRRNLLARRNRLSLLGLHHCFLCHHMPPIAPFPVQEPALQEPALREPAHRQLSHQGSGPSTQSWNKYTGCPGRAIRWHHARRSGSTRPCLLYTSDA